MYYRASNEGLHEGREGRKERTSRASTYPGPIVRDTESRSLQYLEYYVRMGEVMKMMIFFHDSQQSLKGAPPVTESSDDQYNTHLTANKTI
jgi:hypothetical protein